MLDLTLGAGSRYAGARSGIRLNLSPLSVGYVRALALGFLSFTLSSHCSVRDSMPNRLPTIRSQQATPLLCHIVKIIISSPNMTSQNVGSFVKHVRVGNEITSPKEQFTLTILLHYSALIQLTCAAGR